MDASTTPDVAVETAWRESVTPAGGFLSPRIPLDRVPLPFARWQDALAELPGRYHRPDASVRGWLDDAFGEWDPALDGIVTDLGPAETDKLFTVLSFLGHAYRWDSAPPRPDAYRAARIDVPAGIARPWALLARKLDVPRVGNLYSMLGCNWSLRGRTGGEPYRNEELVGDALALQHVWLQAPEDREICAFICTVIETEARGAPALRTIVSLVRAAVRESRHETVFFLDRLRAEIEELGRPFRTYIQKKAMQPDHFLTLIQPTFIWALDEGDGHGPLEGASGPQVGCLQAIDAVLSVPRRSPMAHAILKSRAYMQARHRRFLEVLEANAGVVRAFVEKSRDPQTTALFNACAEGMENWRRIHQKRGALYLKGAAPDYTSTGLVVALDTDRVQAFETAMEQRTRETTEARLDESAATRAPLELVFRYLTAEDREALLAGALRRSCPRDTVLVEAGTRRIGLFVVRTGVVRVEKVDRGRPVAVARLGEGAVFGEMSFLENEDASASVVADTDGEFDVVPREHVYGLFSTREGFAARFFQSLATVLSQRLRDRSGVLAELLGRERPRFDTGRGRRTGRLGTRRRPDEALEGLRTFQARFHDARTGPEVEAAAETLLALARRCASGDEAWTGVADLLARETFAALGASELVDRLVRRPRDVAGDFDTLRTLRTGTASGDGEKGPLLDASLRALPTMRALRALPDALGELVAPIIDGCLGPRVLWFGRGSFDAVARCATGRGQARMTYVELDPDGVATAARQAKEAGLTHVIAAQDDALRLARGRGTIAVGPCDLVVLDIALSELGAHESESVLRWAARTVVPGGYVAIAGLAPDTADRAFFEEILDWPLVRRDGEELAQLLAEATNTLGPARVEVREEGALHLALARRRTD